MKLITLLLMLYTALFAELDEAKLVAMYKTHYNNLTVEQMDVLYEAYVFGNSSNLGLSLSAQAWHESNAGVQLITGGNEQSYGLMHIYLKSFLVRYGIKNTKSNRAKYGTKLILDNQLNLKAGLDELLYWKGRFPNATWRTIIAHYNGGSILEKSSLNYAIYVSARVKVLKEMFLPIVDLTNGDNAYNIEKEESKHDNE